MEAIKYTKIKQIKKIYIKLYISKMTIKLKYYDILFLLGKVCSKLTKAKTKNLEISKNINTS